MKSQKVSRKNRLKVINEKTQVCIDYSDPKFQY